MRVGLSTTLSSAIVLFGVAAHAGEELPRRITLREATAHALERSPARATATARESSADAKVSIAKADATPRVSALGQLNRSTGNVVPGATFAMTGVPGVQGPPGATRFGSGTWQTAAGVTASWDILELVRRPTIVGAAEKDAIAVRAESDVTSVEVVAQTADAYLVAVEARALQRAAEASAKRTDTFHEVVATLAGQKLRPELDLARADTDLAAAHALVEKTRLGTTASAAKLADAIGETGWSVEVVDDDFATLPPAPEPKAGVHPAITAHDDAAKAAEARASVAKLAVMPKVELVGAAWLRGGGYVLGGGPNSGDAEGLLPDTPNWAVGLVATWTPTDILTANAKATAENADAMVQRSKAAAAAADLTTEVKIARATLASYLVIAQETSKAAAAARKAVEIANTRYTTGIGNVVEVADAERAVAAAERDEAIARLEAWRALVAVYHAQGDLRPLVGALAKGKG